MKDSADSAFTFFAGQTEQYVEVDSTGFFGTAFRDWLEPVSSESIEVDPASPSDPADTVPFTSRTTDPADDPFINVDIFI